MGRRWVQVSFPIGKSECLLTSVKAIITDREYQEGEIQRRCVYSRSGMRPLEESPSRYAYSGSRLSACVVPPDFQAPPVRWPLASKSVIWMRARYRLFKRSHCEPSVTCSPGPRELRQPPQHPLERLLLITSNESAPPQVRDITCKDWTPTSAIPKSVDSPTDLAGADECQGGLAFTGTNGPTTSAGSFPMNYGDLILESSCTAG